MFNLAVIPGNWWQEGSSPDPEFLRMVNETIRFGKLNSNTANQEMNSRRMIMCRQAVLTIAAEHSRRCLEPAAFTAALTAGYFPAACFEIELNNNEMKGFPFACGPQESRKRLEQLLQKLQTEQETNLPASPSWFIHAAIKHNLGFVILPEIHPMPGEASSLAGSDPTAQRIESQNINLPIGLGLQFVNETSTLLPVNEALIFEKEVESALSNGSWLNVSSYHHPVITEGLHKYFYGQGRPEQLRIIYDDNSKAMDFPVYQRRVDPSQIEKGEFIPPLRCALMSMRHLEMDPDVDIAWFNNRETSLKGATSAEIDRRCYERSLKLFTRLPEGQPTTIWMYQTGFQPAILGFYRALAQTLIDGRVQIAVKPMIFRKAGSYKPADWWL